MAAAGVAVVAVKVGEVVFDFVVCFVSMLVIALVVVKSLSPAEYLRRHINGDWLPYF